MKPLKLLSLFSGIGAPERALENEGIPFELVAYCEVDKHAARAYSLIHSVDESMNLGDITKVNPQDVPGCDLIMHGSPCQSFSIVGKKQGGQRGSGTTSSLMWYSVEIIKAKHPRFVVWENVPNVLSDKNLPVFMEYIDTLAGEGYESSFDTLNSKDFGVAQDRERLLCISRVA